MLSSFLFVTELKLMDHREAWSCGMQEYLDSRSRDTVISSRPLCKGGGHRGFSVEGLLSFQTNVRNL